MNQQITSPSNYNFEWIKTGNQITENTIHIIGFPFDGTASYKKGAKNGPDATRKVSEVLESYSPFFDKDITEVNCTDLGNLIINDQSEKSYLTVTNNLETLINKTHNQNNVKFLIIGGEHSISLAPITSMIKKHPDLVLLHLDAHADLRNGYEGYHYSHASIIRRCLDNFSDKNKLIQFGIRSGTKEEFQEIKDTNTLASDLDDLLNTLNQIPNTVPVYLTLDLDFFDPAYLPGTGTPEPGGSNYHTFETILDVLNKKNLVGADVVELAPQLDFTDNSSIFATKIIRELILCLA